MKKIFKLLVPVLLIAISFSLLFIPAEAAKQESGYAVWNSEEDYIANPTRPKRTVTTAALDPTILAGGGFVLCYGDVDVSSAVQLSVGAHLVIDLDGHKLTAKAKIIVNGISTGNWQVPGSVTIRNGSLTHASGQFIQGRANSEIYLENLDIEAQVGGSNFITEQSSRIILFKNCKVNFSKTSRGSFIHTSPAYKMTNMDALYERRDYVRNIVFLDTVFNDESKIENGAAQLKIIDHFGSYADTLNISFAGNSTFNQIRDNFLFDECLLEGNRVTVNVSKGARFATEEVPFSARGFKLNYYSSIAVEGHLVNFGEKTELLGAGEEQDTDNPQLIWGKSASTEYPYQLCTSLVKVTWNTPNPLYDGTNDKYISTTVDGYADGVVIENDRSADAGGVVLAPDGQSATVEAHLGWSKTEDGLNPEWKVTLSDPMNVFYAVFVENTVKVLVYKDATKTEFYEDIYITENELTYNDFASFPEGAYLYFFDNMSWNYDDVCSIDKELTIDLAGKTFNKNRVFARGSGSFSVEGVALTVKNGTVSSSFTSFATVTGGGSVTLDGVTATFDTAPAFNVVSGTVTVKNSKIVQMAAETEIPAFSMSSPDGANISVDTSEISLSGPFAVVTAKDGAFGDANINISNAASFTAASLISAYDYSADAIPVGASVSVKLNNVSLSSPKVFDIGTKSDGTSALDIYAEISDSCRFTSKPEIRSGEIKLPLGKSVLGYNKEGDPFHYTVADLDLPEIRFNLALREGFTANFYVPVTSPLTRAASMFSSYTKDELAITAIEGVAYYVIPVAGINPTSILDAINVQVSFISGDTEYTADLEYYVTEYFDGLLDETDPLKKKLTAAAINYIATAYSYRNCEITDDFAVLLSDVRYTDSLRLPEELPKVVSSSNRGNISVAFTGAQLYLSSDLYLRFNLRESFSGTILLEGNYYTVIDGKAGGSNYIQILIPAENFYEEIVSISGTSLDGTAISGSYSLIDYVESQTAEESALSDFIIAFYCYCYEADVSQNDGVVPPVNDHTPPLDVEFR